MTGHRPEDCADEETVREKFRKVFKETTQVSAVIVGMAAGCDLWAGDEARMLGLNVWAAKPWAGHIPREQDIELYTNVLVYADLVVNISESTDYPGPWCYHKRNEWMVDNATHVLAYLNPEKKSGGTYACVNYAKKAGKPVKNIYGDRI